MASSERTRYRHLLAGPRARDVERVEELRKTDEDDAEELEVLGEVEVPDHLQVRLHHVQDGETIERHGLHLQKCGGGFRIIRKNVGRGY